VSVAADPRATVIVSSYNQPEWLEVILSVLAEQTDPAFDVIVADDGSEPPAERLLEKLRPDLPFDVRAVSQPDDGFRKARIQNAAAALSESELLIFLDGDCIPFRNWVEAYRTAWLEHRAREFFVGSVSYLLREETESLTIARARSGAHEDLGRRERMRLASVHLKNLWHAGRKQTRPRFKGGNFAVSAELFREVDGFDEVFCGLAKEDSDLRNRMRNAGARGVSLWNRARVCHIWWPRPFGRGREYPSAELYNAGMQRIRAREGLSGHASQPAG